MAKKKDDQDQPSVDVKAAVAAADTAGTKAYSQAACTSLAGCCEELAAVVESKCPAAAGKIRTAAHLLRSQ